MSWVRSSRCDGATACVLVWRRSSKCESADCVEASHRDGMVGLRDSKHGDDGPQLWFTPDEWDAFCAGVRAGEFDGTP